MNIFKALVKLPALLALARDVPEAFKANVDLYVYIERVLQDDPRGSTLLEAARKELSDVMVDAMAIIAQKTRV